MPYFTLNKTAFITLLKLKANYIHLVCGDVWQH